MLKNDKTERKIYFWGFQKKKAWEIIIERKSSFLNQIVEILDSKNLCKKRLNRINYYTYYECKFFVEKAAK